VFSAEVSTHCWYAPRPISRPVCHVTAAAASAPTVTAAISQGPRYRRSTSHATTAAIKPNPKPRMVNQASAAMYSSGDGSPMTMPFCPALITGTVGARTCQSTPSGPPAIAITTTVRQATANDRRHCRR
jgi:hypothetical protein